jgi:ribonucleotide reductase beta subunit family protein with ferritin-like domain
MKVIKKGLVVYFELKSVNSKTNKLKSTTPKEIINSIFALSSGYISVTFEKKVKLVNNTKNNEVIIISLVVDIGFIFFFLK